MSSNRSIASFAVSLFTASLLAAGAFAQADSGVTVKNAPKAPAGSAGKSCEDLKAEIDGKIKAKGVKAFTLEILPAADAKDAKVVGSCEAGAKKITYKRG